ncbi:basic phospholipase A2 pseudexin A chain [Sipha flava]|uniref:Phospholipase A2 n=1 Tax=Sipha flava TaxID=143950 RepID=A0A2S2QBD9_9HEMI|nr:basic phospholipase A2 pseudexin A chain [Sipha flava]XP_025419105.1 basic phospholipase A2 pseudexin A chain [Sipha flava]XP_025419106.1 basic phospholipase A2 pseudexin A chain [Sipha flava]
MLKPVDIIYTLLAILHQLVYSSQDINALARKIYHKNGTAVPIDIYVSYTNNPWGPSAVLDNGQSSSGKEQYRPKRSVYQLYNMVVCATGCNPLSYLGYGCYCGFLGSGSPVDPIDNCCKMHDWCYDSADCPMFLEYFTPYVWTCYNKKPLCSMGGGCSQRLCECDQQLAMCLKRFGCPTQKALCKTSPWRWFQNVLF